MTILAKDDITGNLRVLTTELDAIGVETHEDADFLVIEDIDLASDLAEATNALIDYHTS